MKKITFILALLFLITGSFSLPGKLSPGSAKSLIDAYCATGNPANDYIYVHLWNAGHNYNFSVPPHAASGYVMGQIEAECGYSVTLTSSGGPHTMQFYWFYASNVVTATNAAGDMCPTCASCPSLRISN